MAGRVLEGLVPTYSLSHGIRCSPALARHFYKAFVNSHIIVTSLSSHNRSTADRIGENVSIVISFDPVLLLPI